MQIDWDSAARHIGWKQLLPLYTARAVMAVVLLRDFNLLPPAESSVVLARFVMLMMVCPINSLTCAMCFVLSPERAELHGQWLCSQITLCAIEAFLSIGLLALNFEEKLVWDNPAYTPITLVIIAAHYVMLFKALDKSGQLNDIEHPTGIQDFL